MISLNKIFSAGAFLFAAGMGRHHSVDLDSDQDTATSFANELIQKARDKGFRKDDLFAIRLALEEALVNAIKHGNKKDPEKKIKIEYCIGDDFFDITITDSGEGFDPEKVPDPRADGNVYKPCGRGLLLMKSYMDVVEYNETGNTVHMLKKKTTKTEDRI